MVSASVEIDESNGDSETVTHGVLNINYGSYEIPNLSPISFRIVRGDNSYEKWIMLHVTDLGDSTQIDNIKIWRTGSISLGTGGAHKANLKTAAYVQATYATPVSDASSVAIVAHPSSEPASANLGIGGSLVGALTDVGYSDYYVSQILTGADATIGSHSQLVLSIEYDEV